MSRPRSLALIGAFAAGVGVCAPASADLATCQKQIVKQLLKYERVFVKKFAKCFDLENLLRIPGPCPDTTAQDKIDAVNLVVVTKIAENCTPADLTALGFPSSCGAYGSAATSAGAACTALPASTVEEIVECVKCWKSAELSSYLAVLFASHALEMCDGSLDDTSPSCMPLECTTPLPDQRNLGTSGGDSDCQRGVGKGGAKYLVLRAKALASCGLLGNTRAQCLADVDVQEKLAVAEIRKETVIMNKCGNRDPEPNPPFCCRTTGNMCIAAATREDCTNGGNEVQEDKFCDVDSTCATLGGTKQFTWWGSCPDSQPCPGTALATADDMAACVDSVADRVVDRLLCLQLRANGGADWPCPGSPGGAFVD